MKYAARGTATLRARVRSTGGRREFQTASIAPAGIIIIVIIALVVEPAKALVVACPGFHKARHILPQPVFVSTAAHACVCTYVFS
jgi:hypothetical protein